MTKTKTMYVCQNCGADSPKWIGRCPSCGEWNTYVEEVISKGNTEKNIGGTCFYRCFKKTFW
jgi:DNA repair protein RadA/Sms